MNFVYIFFAQIILTIHGSSGFLQPLTGAIEVIQQGKLRSLQEKGRSIVSSFVPTEYNPHPYLKNPHLQTILGVYVRNEPGVAYIDTTKQNYLEQIIPVGKAVFKKALELMFTEQELERSCDFWMRRERFLTNDGDFYDVDFKYVDENLDLNVEQRSSDGMVIIIHGLESNSNSSLCTNMATAFLEKNLDVACINFRGCSGEPNDTILQYHGGFTDDILHFLDVWKDRTCCRKPLYISAFSLGSNVALKLLGDLSVDAVYKYNIRGAAVSGAPFDLEHHYRQLIDYDFHRIVYAGSVLRSMKKKVNYLVDRFYGGDASLALFDYELCMNAKTIAEIEDGMIAPLFGFEDRFDYYRKSASLPVIDQIAVPTFVLNAADDPFFNRDTFPFEKDCGEAGGVAPLKLVRTEAGGHLGHLFHISEDDIKPTSSFMPIELARFISHISSL